MSHGTILVCALAAVAAAPQDRGKSSPRDQSHQYIFFHLRTPRLANPSTLTPQLLKDIPLTIGTPGSERLRFGVAYTFNIMEQPAPQLAKALEQLLSASEQAGVPVFICLDGQNWWESRSDLWNWWDPGRPGYNPGNRANVEWFGWGPEYAVKIGWRNWGRQLRVAPAPNIESPAVLAEHDRALRELVPIIAKWRQSLPRDRKLLFGGFKVGWEASINVNAYYYFGGNDIYEKSPKDGSKDPNDHKSANGWTFGQQPIGYNAVSTAGIRRSGELSKEDLEIVVHRYLERLSKTVNELGIPKNLIFTHQGGTYAPWEQHLSFKPAINEYSVPGWSFYSHDPPECGSLASDMESAGREEWGAVEWLRKGENAGQWRMHFERTLSFKRCRLVNIYNWEGVRDDPAVLEAVRALVGAPGRQ